MNRWRAESSEARGSRRLKSGEMTGGEQISEEGNGTRGLITSLIWTSCCTHIPFSLLSSYLPPPPAQRETTEVPSARRIPRNLSQASWDAPRSYRTTQSSPDANASSLVNHKGTSVAEKIVWLERSETACDVIN